MDPNEKGAIPKRRSLIPGASEEIPVTHPVEDAAAYEGDAHRPDTHDALTEVYGSFAPAPSLAPPPAGHGAGGGSRPWFRRPWVIATAAGVVVIGVAIGVVLALAGGGTPMAVPTVSPSPTETPPSPSPSASVEPGVPTLLDDGIAADEYPPSAPSAGAGYPAALTMEEWVWDHVGPAWTLVSLANYDPSTSAVGPSVIYLASPEGVLFDLVHVNTPGGLAQVVSWLASDRKARIQISPVAADARAGGALVDLQTGTMEDMSFTTSAGRSTTERFIAQGPGGGEVWTAESDDYRSVRFESWTRSGGWKRVLADADISLWAAVASQSGSLIANEIVSTDDTDFASARSGPPGQPVIVVFDVDSGAQTLVRPAYDVTTTPWCDLSAVTNTGQPILTCWDESINSQKWMTATDGKPLEAASADAVLLPLDFWQTSAIDLPALGISLVSARNDMQVYEVSVTTGGSSVVVLKAGVDIPYGGLSQFYAGKATDGVVIVRAAETCALIDTKNAHSVTLATTTVGVIGCLSYGKGNGIPPSYPYWGQEG